MTYAHPVSESVTHSLIFCEFVKQVWDMWEDYPVNLTIVSMDVSDIAMRILVEGTSQHLEDFFMTAWSIWNRCSALVISNKGIRDLLGSFRS